MSVFRFEAPGPKTSTPLRRIPHRNSIKIRNSPSSPIFAFSTSPSILQDITLENSAMDSPTGLTMKEYDEHLSKLTAENFQLKLKIYFMDTKLSKIDTLTDRDLFRENVELKVECEAKSKELEKKQKLLHDASEVVDELQVKHKREINRLTEDFQREKNDLELKLAAMEASMRVLEDYKVQQSEVTPLSVTVSEVEMWQQRVKDVESRLEEQTTLADELRQKIERHEKTISTLGQEKLSLIKEFTTVKNQLEKITECPDVKAHQKLIELEKTLTYKQEKLDSLTQDYAKACAAISKFVRRANADKDENDKLKLEISELKTRVEKYQSPLQERTENESERTIMQNQLVEKQNEIDQLRDSLSKRTHNLQEVVNKELWSKNQQIERLEKKINDLAEVHDYKSDVEKLRLALDDVTFEKEALKQEIASLKAKELPLRQACTALVARLEELAGFLDTFLTEKCEGHPSLTLDEQSAVRRAIEQSRDLSRNLNISLDTDAVLSEALFINDQSQLVTNLRKQVASLSQQVLHRDIEVSLCTTKDEILWSHTIQEPKDTCETHMTLPHNEEKTVRLSLINHQSPKKEVGSESETWSEPDRSVSQARMGHVDSGTPIRLSKYLGDPASGSSDETLNENRVAVKRTRSVENDSRKLQVKLKSSEEANKALKLQLYLLEKKYAVLQKLHDGGGTPQLLEELNQCLSDLEEKTHEYKILCDKLSEKDDTIKLKDKELMVKVSECLEIHGRLNSCFDELEETRELCELLKKQLANEQLIIEEKDKSIKEMQIELDNVQLESKLKYEEANGTSQNLQIRLLGLEERLESNERLRTDLEKQLIDSESVRTELKERLFEKERVISEKEERLREVELMRRQLEQKVAHIDSKILETQRCKIDAEKQVREAEEHIMQARKIVKEAEASRENADRKVLKLEKFIKTLQEQIEEKTRANEERAVESDRQICELRRKLTEAERSKAIIEQKVKESRARIQWMESKLKELEDAMECCGSEAQSWIDKEIKLGVETRLFELRNEWMSREEVDRLLEKQNELFEERLLAVEQQRDRCYVTLQETEKDFTTRLQKLEDEKIDLQTQLEAVEFEVARLERDKELLEHQIHSQKEDLAVNWGRTTNTSPDLGIESDQGRFSSLELPSDQAAGPRPASDVLAENEDLRKRITHLRQILDVTRAELATAHQQKKVMEHAICRQLHKTHHILKKARVNLEDPTQSS